VYTASDVIDTFTSRRFPSRFAGGFAIVGLAGHRGNTGEIAHRHRLVRRLLEK
jgi:hypothetical protein